MSDKSKDSDSSDSSDLSECEAGDTDADGLQPRKYQLELAENALMGRNTIICSGTGSGKTIVALHIIKKHLEGAPKGTRKVVFMAKTGALIKQQSEKCKRYLEQYETRLITGDEDKTKSINMFMEHYDIFCFTPQILVNSLDDKLVGSLSEFSLLVLDECHNTRGDEPYSMLMRKYLVEKHNGTKNLPQIVGLTASVGVGKSRTIAEAKEYILRLCACLDVSHISTVKEDDDGYKKHNKKCTEETIRLVKRTVDPTEGILLSAMEKTEGMLAKAGLIQPDICDLISDKHPKDKESQEYNKWTVEIMKAAQLKVDDYDVSRNISSCAKYLNIYNSALEVNKLLRIKDIIRYLAEKHQQEGEHRSKLTEMETQLYNNLIDVQKEMKTQIKCTENPNVKIVSEALSTMFDAKGAESRAMVFVKTRATCKSLAAYLDEELQQNGINASPLYGKENRAGDEGMTEIVQTDILEKFRTGIFKVLVCTAVGNEGIDVPNCNIVLSYEYSGDEITKIQMKGRARQAEATSVIMGSEKILEQERINAYKALMMYRALDEVCKLNPKLIAQKSVQFQKEEIQKYLVKVEGNKTARSKNSSEDDYDILCGRCNTFVCNISNVRRIGHDHIVIDKTFENRINRKEHKRPKSYDGICKKYKMYCRKCPLDWGIIGIKDGLDYMALKIKNLKFKNLRTGNASVCKKWDDIPEVQKIDHADLLDILNKGNDQIENQSQPLEESDDINSSKRSNIVTSFREGGCSTKTQNVETDLHKEGAATEEFTSTNNGETTDSVGRTDEIAASNGKTLRAKTPECSEKESRKRKLTADTSIELVEAKKTTKDTMTSVENIERNVTCCITPQDMSAKVQEVSNIAECSLTDVDTNNDMKSASSSLKHESSLGYPFKKSQDDTLSQSMVDKLSGQMQSVGILISPRTGSGTVFRVGSKYLMTAFHVVKDILDPNGFIRDVSVYVIFNESVLDIDRQMYRLTKIVFWNQVLDVAVLELANSDNDFPPKMQLSKYDVTTLNVNKVSFIGYGHPDKDYAKHLDPNCKLISPQSQRFKDAHKWLDSNEQYLKRTLKAMEKDPEIVNKGYAGYTDDHKIIFDCYMQQGASGSPALAYNMEVVGIFTHGLPEFYFLMPKILQPSVDNNYRFEVGSRMSSIYNCILKADKDLAKDLFE